MSTTGTTLHPRTDSPVAREVTSSRTPEVASSGIPDVASSGRPPAPWGQFPLPSFGVRGGIGLLVVAMLCVQLGIATAVGIFDQVGPMGAAWLRLAWAGLIMLAVVRPRPGQFTPQSFAASALLGVVTAGITLLFMGAVERLPMHTASALEFLGPLGVAVARSHGRARLFALLAAAGVLLLTEPWHGGTDTVGVALALGAAACWAAYILLTQRVGDQVSGLAGLAVSMPVAGLVASAVAGPSVAPLLTWDVMLYGLGLALLLPVVPFTLELLVLRRISTGAFGTLMALEPGFALVIGMVVLAQVPGVLPLVGLAFVVAAGIGAERTGARRRTPADAAEAGA